MFPHRYRIDVVRSVLVKIPAGSFTIKKISAGNSGNDDDVVPSGIGEESRLFVYISSISPCLASLRDTAEIEAAVSYWITRSVWRS